MDYNFRNDIQPEKGKILISDPYKNDSAFERSVIYLCNHDNEGSFGFVVNKPLRISMKGINERFPETILTGYQGGPVSTDTLFFLHTLGDRIKGSQHIKDGIYLGSNYTELYTIITPELVEEGAIKLFIGYSGWGSHQLEQEIHSNFWAVIDCKNPNDFMQSRDNLWHFFMQQLGGKYDVMKNFPINPNDN